MHKRLLEENEKRIEYLKLITDNFLQMNVRNQTIDPVSSKNINQDKYRKNYT